MISKVIQQDSTSQRFHIFIQDATTGMGKTGLLFNTTGLAFSYCNGQSDTAHALSLVTQSVGAAFAAGGFVEIDSVKMPGWYQFDCPDTVFASGHGNSAQVVWKGTGILDGAIDIELTAYNPDTIDKTNFSLSSAAILSVWQQAVSAFSTAGTIGKVINDNLPTLPAAVTANQTAINAVKTKTDALTVVSGGVVIAPSGLDNLSGKGYYPAGNAPTT